MVGLIRFRVMTSGILCFVCMGLAVMGFSEGVTGIHVYWFWIGLRKVGLDWIE